MTSDVTRVLAEELDRHWFSVQPHPSGGAIGSCSCGWSKDFLPSDVPVLGDHVLPFSEHVAEALLAGSRLLTIDDPAYRAWLALERLDGLIVISPPHHRHPDSWVVRVHDHASDEDDAEVLYGEGPSLVAALAALTGPRDV